MHLTFKLLQTFADMGALLLHCGVKSLILLLALIALLGLARRSAASLRHTLWLGGCVALLLLPLLTWRLPPWQPPVPPVAAEPAPHGAQTAPVPPAPVNSALLLTLTAGRAAPAPFFDRGEMALSIGCVLWLLGVGVCAIRLGNGQRAARKLLRLSHNVEDHAIQRELAECAHSLGLTRSPRLLTGPVPVPLTWGAFHPVVMIPEAALTWPVSCRRAALFHELSHIRRGDWLAQSVASLTSTLYWFNPLVWVAARGLRLESERATDDRVLLTGIPAPDYSSCLVEILRLMGVQNKDSVMKFVLPIAGSSRLETRVRSILDPRQKRGAASGPVLAAVVLLGAMGLVPLAAARERTVMEPDLSTPESALRSFASAFEANQFEVALSCVAGAREPGPFLKEFQRRSSWMPKIRAPLSELQTVMHGDDAQILIKGQANLQMLSEDGRVVANGTSVAGAVRFHRDAQGWKMVAQKRNVRTAKSLPISLLPDLANSLVTDIVPAPLSLAARSDATLAQCVMNLQQLEGAVNWLNPIDKVNAKNWKQTFLAKIRVNVRPGSDLEPILHCPDDASGTESYSLNPVLDGMEHSRAFSHGGNIVFLYEGHNRKLDYRHNGKAVVVTVANGTKLVSPQEAKSLIWTAN